MEGAAETINGRLAASVARVEFLTAAFNEWLAVRRAADRWQQYSTQLDTIAVVITNCLTAVAATIPSAEADWVDVYDACRLSDRRAVWVERVWRFFADRFDQRDGPDARRTCLQAADEVLWSCWRPCFTDGTPRNDRPPPPGAVPLPFLDAVHTPEAFPAGLVPADLAASYADTPFVRDHLTRLPVPTVRVPAAATHEPWLLGLIAHEAGHHLQFGSGLGQAFRTAVTAAVGELTPDPDTATRWAEWSVEIFADLASVALIGPWALWPIAELELGTQPRMKQPRAGYPPGIVRLRLLEEAASILELDPKPAWPSAQAALLVHSADLPDLTYVTAVVEAGLNVAPPGFTLATWTGFDPADFGPASDVQQWRRWFGGGPRPATTPSLKAPRIVLAGAVAATADARRAPDAQRPALEAAVREHAYQEMIALRVGGTRASSDPQPVDGDLAALATAIAQAGDNLLDEPTAEPDGASR